MADVTDTDSENIDTNTDDSADKKLANLVNAAVSSHMKRFMKQMEAQQKPTQSQSPASTAQSDDTDVRKELQMLKAQLRVEKAKAREDRAYSDVRSRLTGKVRDDALDLALKVFRADQRIVLDEDGNPSFRHDGIDHDLDDGLNEWLATKEAAIFRPAPNPQKRGVKPGIKAPSRSGVDLTKEIQDPLMRAQAQMAALGVSI